MIVWQSLVGGRWQIAYKEGTSSVEYLTANPDGNGHPATDGKHIVWQGWSGNNWDIFLAEPGNAGVSFAATTTGVLAGIHPGWTVTRLSMSPSHDMFPKIAGNFVTWQEHRGESWVIVVYDISTGQSRTIEGSAGGTGEAPTVALIFKERTKEGRVFIRASDLATGQRIPLREDELPEPAKLPIPEQSGALPLQSGTSTASSTRSEGDGDAGGTPVL
jgi:beta propeller repeat protein